QPAQRHPRSLQIITRMTTLNNLPAYNQVANYLTPNDGSAGWPTYWSNGSDQTYTIVCGVPADEAARDGYTPDCSVKKAQAHAPVGAKVQGNDPLNGDRHMTIVDQTNGLNKEYDLWHVSVSPLPG